MSIRIKLLILVTIMIIGPTVIEMLSIHQQKKTSTIYTEMQEDESVQFLMKSIQFRFTGISNDERAFLLTGDEKLIEGINEKQLEIEDFFKELEKKQFLTSEDKKQLNLVHTNLKTYFEVGNQMIQTFQSGDSEKSLQIHMQDQRSIRKEKVDPTVESFIEKLTKEMISDKSMLID